MATACSKLSGCTCTALAGGPCGNAGVGGTCCGPWVMWGPCVGDALSFGKFMLAGFNCSVDGLFGVGGNILP